MKTHGCSIGILISIDILVGAAVKMSFTVRGSPKIHSKTDIEIHRIEQPLAQTPLCLALDTSVQTEALDFLCRRGERRPRWGQREMTNRADSLVPKSKINSVVF